MKIHHDYKEENSKESHRSIHSLSYPAGLLHHFLQPAEEHTFTATFFLKAVVLVPGQQSSATIQPATVCVPAQATLVHSLNFA
tara:strand:- start:267 stop:515 length:249 start_codon:yes stop_codon:yes gene_type:complete